MELKYNFSETLERVATCSHCLSYKQHNYKINLRHAIQNDSYMMEPKWKQEENAK